MRRWPTWCVCGLLVAACAGGERATTESATSEPVAATSTTDATTTTATTARTATSPATASLCEVLRTAGYETRKAARAELVAAEGDAALDGVRAECPGDLDRLDAAQAIEARRDAVLAVKPAVQINDVTCEDNRFSAEVVNRSDEPLGVHLAFRIYLMPVDRLIATGDEPVVIWRLEPGQTVTVEGTYSYVPRAHVVCSMSGHLFLVDDSPADAGLAEPVDPALTGDEPATWLPALHRAELDARGSGRPDDATIVEDIRSPSYATVVAITTPPAEPRPRGTIRVCPGTVRQPSPDLAVLVFALETPDELELLSGVFRRGSDGQWRWLGTAEHYRSSALWESCGRPAKRAR